MIYKRATSNVKYVQDNYGLICKKRFLKDIHILVKALAKLTMDLEIAYLEFATNL